MDYESTLVVSPELSQEKIEELTAKAIKIIETSEGTIKVVQQLGKKKLAYAIDKFREGSYVYVEFAGGGETVYALENFLKFNDSVMRFLTVKIKKKKKEVAATSAPKPDLQEKSQDLDIEQSLEVKQNESETEQSSLT
ncbi:MAG: 30S ribosomal protein S6 [Endomicrobium sp.]|jgi:small subunit ribosomal protein S6|nr:30S ribosomal protein S6 [Endomicrobium sp.]